MYANPGNGKNLNDGLRSKVMSGGAYLAIRQALGMAIGIAGVLILTRVIGPKQYGLYAAAIGIFSFVQLITQLGIGVYIIRSEKEVDAALRDTAATLLFALALAAAAVLIAVVPLLERFTRLAGLGPVAIAVFVTLPIAQLAQIPLAQLDRSLNYRLIAWVELAAQAAFTIVAITLALLDWGAWALVTGWFTQQLLLLVLLHTAVGYWPRFAWNREYARDAVEYGVGYTASTWLYQLRRLVNPLVVGRYVGAEAVAIVSVTTQIVNNLSFISVATWRLSTAALARVQMDRARIARAINDGMLMQVAATAPFLIAFAIAGPMVVEYFMGTEWTPISTLFPFLALVSLTTSVFNLHASALYVLRKNTAMALYHIAHSGTLAAAALILVRRSGLVGYGAAEIITILTFVVLHQQTAREIQGLKYMRVAAMIVCVTPVLFFTSLGPWSLAALPLALLATPKHLLKTIRDLPVVNIAATSVVKFFVRSPSLRLAQYLPRTGLVEAVLPNGERLRLWSRADDLIASPVYWRGWDGYERETSRIFYEHAVNARVILDIGAHVGYFTVLGARANPAGRVFSFEPNPTVHERLQRNIAVNELTNVEAMQKAVGKVSTTAPFYFVPEGVPANSSLSLDYISVCDTVETTEVEVVAIDEFLAQRGVDCVDLVKIDTETTEADVLAGMADTLARCKPVIICEILSDEAGAAIHAILDPLGYRTQKLAADGRNFLFTAGSRS